MELKSPSKEGWTSEQEFHVTDKYDEECFNTDEMILWSLYDVDTTFLASIWTKTSMFALDLIFNFYEGFLSTRKIVLACGSLHLAHLSTGWYI